MGWETLLFLCMLLALAGIAIGLVVGSIWLVVRYFRKKEQARTARKLAARARTPIASATDGAVVKVEGKVRLLPRTLAAPITGRTCAYYSVVIEQKKSAGRRHWWENAVVERRGAELLVEDDTGRALVVLSAPDVSVELLMDANTSSGMFQARTPALEEVVRRYGLDPTTVFGLDRAFRYHEGALVDGERVAVSGVARWEADPDPSGIGGMRGGARRLVVSAPRGEPLLVSDHPDAWSRR